MHETPGSPHFPWEDSANLRTWRNWLSSWPPRNLLGSLALRFQSMAVYLRIEGVFVRWDGNSPKKINASPSSFVFG